jgi:uncharacterized lipoprotein NlpE involved in copper resistance
MLNNLKNKVMKNMFAMLMLVGLMLTACNNTTETQTENVAEPVDSAVVDSTTELSPATDSTATAQ